MMADQSTKFWDKMAERYSRRPVADQVAYAKKLEVTRGYFQPHMEALEIGCGTGSTAIAHAPYVKHIQAIDISSKMIQIACSKADAEGVNNVTFAQSTIDQLDVPGASVDVVLGLSILHLVESLDDVIAAVYEMLKPGGVFVTNTACIADSMKFFKFIAPVGRFLGLMPLVKVFTMRELEEGMINAGFEIDYQWQPGKGKAAFIVAKKLVNV